MRGVFLNCRGISCSLQQGSANRRKSPAACSKVSPTGGSFLQAKQASKMQRTSLLMRFSVFNMCFGGCLDVF